jgi:MoxR-like ATPase
MEFHCYETRQTVQARHRPLVIITSNNEKELPDAFLRRCFFHYIRFPDAETLQRIVQLHFPGLREDLVTQALQVFLGLRQVPGLKKKPSTSELIDWMRLLAVQEVEARHLQGLDRGELPPLLGALLKNEQDISLLERLAQMQAQRR